MIRLFSTMGRFRLHSIPSGGLGPTLPPITGRSSVPSTPSLPPAPELKAPSVLEKKEEMKTLLRDAMQIQEQDLGRDHRLLSVQDRQLINNIEIHSALPSYVPSDSELGRMRGLINAAREALNSPPPTLEMALEHSEIDITQDQVHVEMALVHEDVSIEQDQLEIEHVSQEPPISHQATVLEISQPPQLQSHLVTELPLTHTTVDIAADMVDLSVPTAPTVSPPPQLVPLDSDQKALILSHVSMPVTQLIEMLRAGDESGRLVGVEDSDLRLMITQVPEYAEARYSPSRIEAEAIELRGDIVKIGRELRNPDLPTERREMLTMMLDEKVSALEELPLRENRMVNPDGNVFVSAMIKAAPELATTEVVGKRIEKMWTQLEGMESKLTDLQAQLTTARGEYEAMKTAHPAPTPEALAEKKEEVFGLGTQINRARDQMREVSDRLADLEVAHHISTHTHGDGHMAWSSVKDHSGDMLEMLAKVGRLEIVTSTMSFADRLLGIDGTELIKRAVGSVNKTSDYDLTRIPVDQRNTGLDTAAVGKFNEIFAARWGRESGSALDTNLYEDGLALRPQEELMNGPKQWGDEAAHALHDRGQDIASLVKQRRYMTDEQWDGYQKALLEKVPETKQEEVKARYAEANQWYKEFKTELKTRMDELRESKPEMSDFDLELAISNRMYVEQSLVGNALRREFVQLDAKVTEMKASMGDNPSVEQKAELAALITKRDTTYAQATTQASKANICANEGYLSEGPFRHVVINEQAIKRDPELAELVKTSPHKKLAVSREQMMESLTENFGDSLKDLHHYRDRDVGEITFRSAKYVGRICRVAEDLLTPQQRASLPGFQDLINNFKAAEEGLLRLRGDGDPREIREGENRQQAQAREAREIMAANGLGDITSVDQLREKLTTLTLQATTLLRST